MNGRTLLLGIGNLVLTDDGFGVHVIRHLQQLDDLPADWRLLDGGTLGLALSFELAEADQLVVFDAARLDQPAGSLQVLVDADMDRFLRERGRSAHQVGLADLMDTARLSGDLPQRRALVAVQPESMDWGDQLSPAVAASVHAAARAAIDLLRDWSQSPA